MLTPAVYPGAIALFELDSRIAGWPRTDITLSIPLP